MDVFPTKASLFHFSQLLSSIPDDCVIFALGIAGVITYERDLQKYSEQRCRIISVDSVSLLLCICEIVQL